MSNHNIQPWQSTSPRNACEKALADHMPIVSTLCRAFSLNFPSGVLLLLFLMGIALQGAACVLDGVGRRISLKINMLLLAPLASGQVLVQFLTDVARAVEIAVAAQATQRHAQYKATAATRVQMREQIELAIRKKVAEKVRLDALSTLVAKLLAEKPEEADFVDFEQKLVVRNQRIADLELAIEQARVDDDAEAVKVHRQELRRLRADEPISYETATRNWERKFGPAVRQRDELGNVDVELAVLNDSLAELNLREQAELEPVEPRVVYANVPIPAMCKSLGTGWPVAIGLVSGPAVLKALCRHMTPFVDMTGGRMLSKYAGGSVVTSFFATTPQDAFQRDLKALGQDAAAVSGAFLVSSDANVEGFDGAMTLAESMSLPAVKELIVKMAIDRTIAMMDAGFAQTDYSLSDEALSVLAEADKDIQRVRRDEPIHPAQDALLVNMPQTICAVAGLLHAWKPNGAALQPEAVDRAISICKYFDAVFQAVVVPPPEELGWALMLRDVLCRIVAKKVSRGDKNAYVMAISTILNKASSIGMTRAQIRRAIEFMLREGWAKLQDHGTDDFDEILVLDQSRFGGTSPL